MWAFRPGWWGACAGLALVWTGCHAPASKPGAADLPSAAAVVEPGGRGMEAMVRIPAGVLERGDGTGVGYADERPVRPVAVAGFWMERYEVSWRLWKEVQLWASDHGYSFDDLYDFHPDRNGDHPVCLLSWYDAVKWCNARSEMNGRAPVYFVDAARTRVYREGQVDLTAEMVLWEGQGYRLPTEAEWEWAARGGLRGQHYPWPSVGEDLSVCLDGSQANYWESGDPWESDAECATSPVGFFDGRPGLAGQDMANGYGLYDMAGNVSEWCWDWYLDRWYEDPGSAEPPVRGPAAGYGRVLRGGGWISSPKYCRVAARYMSGPDYRCHCYGLRCVVSLLPDAELSVANARR